MHIGQCRYQRAAARGWREQDYVHSVHGASVGRPIIGK